MIFLKADKFSLKSVTSGKELPFMSMSKYTYKRF